VIFIRWVEENDIVRTIGWDKAQNRFNEISMRVDDTHTLSGNNVGEDPPSITIMSGSTFIDS
jgi:hypothetical protein